MASEIAGGKDITRSIDTNVCYFSMFSDDIKTSGSPKEGYFTYTLAAGQGTFFAPSV